MNEDLLKMQSEMIEDLRKMVKEQELEIEHLVGRKLDLESQVRILTKKNTNLKYYRLWQQRKNITKLFFAFLEDSNDKFFYTCNADFDVLSIFSLHSS